jgi:hypothetical protein
VSTFTLSGSGTQAVSAPGSLALAITTLPAIQSDGRANPANHYDVGLLRLGTAHGYLAAFPIDATAQLIPCPAGVSIVGYSLFNGAVVTIEERAEIPWQGPPGPTGPTGPTGSTGPAGASGATTISDTILSAVAASFDLTSIPGTYTALRLELALRGDSAAQSVIGRLRFNGDTGSNYWYTARNTASTATSSVQSAATTSILLQHQPGASDSVAGEFGMWIIDLPFYSSTVFDKIAHARGYLTPTGGTNISEMYDVAGYWRSVVAITQVTISPTAGNWAIGSRCLLRGIT